MQCHVCWKCWGLQFSFVSCRRLTNAKTAGRCKNGRHPLLEAIVSTKRAPNSTYLICHLVPPFAAGLCSMHVWFRLRRSYLITSLLIVLTWSDLFRVFVSLVLLENLKLCNLSPDIDTFLSVSSGTVSFIHWEILSQVDVCLGDWNTKFSRLH